jgi:DNA polymerase-3 subunit beta
MNFTVGKSALLRELGLLQGVVEKKNTVPMLSNVLLEAKDQSTLQLVATDLEVSLETACTADVSTPGSAALNARKLFDIIRSLPDGDVSFTKDENDWVRINCGYTHFRMAGLAKEHFPSTPRPEGASMTLPPSVFHNLIVRTVFAITQEESRYALGGALLMIAGGWARMVATDGHRLGMASCQVEGQFEEVKVIVPKKALNELLKLTAGVEDPVQFSRGQNHLFFKIGSRLFTSTMLSGQFPNFELVIPKDNDKRLEIGSESLGQSIRRVALMADERSHGVRFELSEGKLTVSSQTADFGEAKDIVSVDYSGSTVSVGFNAQYLLDFLGAIGSEKAVVELKDEQSPVLFKPVDSSNFEYKYVVMPMRLV